MRTKFTSIFAAIVLIACTSTPPKTQMPATTSLSYREQLDIYKDMKIRIYRVGDKIKSAGIGVCRESINEDGVLMHQLSDYPERMRPIAKSYWGLTDANVRLANTTQLRHAVCPGTLVLSYENEPNAWTDGVDIFVTPTLLDQVDDLALALIIAHELAHISLNHATQEQTEKLEREADRFALFILARANLDYKKAALQDTASKQPHISESNNYADTEKRAEHFRKIVAEINKLKAAGKLLVP